MTSLPTSFAGIAMRSKILSIPQFLVPVAARRQKRGAVSCKIQMDFPQVYLHVKAGRD